MHFYKIQKIKKYVTTSTALIPLENSWEYVCTLWLYPTAIKLATPTYWSVALRSDGITISSISLKRRYRLLATFCDVVCAGREIINLRPAVQSTIVPYQGIPTTFMYSVQSTIVPYQGIQTTCMYTILRTIVPYVLRYNFNIYRVRLYRSKIIYNNYARC